MTRSLVAVAGTSLCVRSSGAPDGVPLVFWHGLGFGGTGSVLDVATPALVEAGYRTIAPDAPGFGRSEPLPREAFSVDRLVDLLWELVDALGLARPLVLSGHSWGGTVAITAAARRPDDVRALVLFDSGHRDYGDWPDARPEATIDELIAELDAETMPETWDELESILVAEGFGQPWTLAAWREAFDVDSAAGLRRLGTNEAMAAARVGLAQARASEAWPTVAAARIPALFLLATEPSQERESNTLCVEQVRAAIPHAELRLIDGMRHAVFADIGAEAGVIAAKWLHAVGAAERPTS